MNNLEIIKNNLTPDVKFMVNDTDFIMLKTFNMAQQAEAAKLAPRLENLKNGEGKDVIIDGEILRDISILLNSIIERSVDGISSEDVDNFVSGHFIELMQILEKLMPGNKSKTEAINKRLEDMKNVRN
jgi:hypothetical protein